MSLGANSDNLDHQNGGFTVFGKVTRSTFGNAQVFGNPSVFPVFDYSPYWGTAFSSFSGHVYGNPQIEEFELFTSVALVPLPAGQAGEVAMLTYSVLTNSNPSAATASILPDGKLDLTPQAGRTGSTTVAVRATDSVGNTVDDTFVLTVNDTDTYTTWASRSMMPAGQGGIASNPDGDPLINLLEYAFLCDPVVSDRDGLPLMGKTGVLPASQFMTLTFPVRKFTSGLRYVVEACDTLEGPWSTAWTSDDGFGHSQVVSALDQADRTVVTIKDTTAIGAGQRRFIRTRVVQE